MELLFFLPLLLVGGLVFGGGSSGSDANDDDDDTPSEEREQLQTGTSGRDEMSGTALNDVLLGDSGADVINGLDGNDILAGEFGPDRLNGGAGDDILLGGPGNDVLSGGTGRDLLIGGAGDDMLMGGFGNDLLIGASGSDTLLGGEGNDTLIGVEYDLISEEMSETADDVRAAVAREISDPSVNQIADRIANGVESGNPAERGPDLLEGGAGNDLLFGDDGDTLTGGAGDDAFVVVYRSGENASIITDFDHQAEALTLVLDNPDTAAILIRADGPNDSVVLVDGEPVVRLTGQTAADLSMNPPSWLFVERL